MESDQADPGHTINSFEEVDVGDVLYLEESSTVYWVTEATPEEMTFMNKDGEVETIQNEQLENTVDENTWILQSKAPRSTDQLRLDPEG